MPATLDAYRHQLGKAARSYLSRYLNRLRRQALGVEHRVQVGAAIDVSCLCEIIRLNDLRMHAKSKAPMIDDALTQRIVRLARQYGMVSMFFIDGAPVRRHRQLRVGDHYFFEVITHDPAYDDL